MTGAIAHKTQQLQFGEPSKLAVPHNWPVVKLSNVILEFILLFNILYRQKLKLFENNFKDSLGYFFERSQNFFFDI
jgi:hypothetical protein